MARTIERSDERQEGGTMTVLDRVPVGNRRSLLALLGGALAATVLRELAGADRWDSSPVVAFGVVYAFVAGSVVGSDWWVLASTLVATAPWLPYAVVVLSGGCGPRAEFGCGAIELLLVFAFLVTPAAFVAAAGLGLGRIIRRRRSTAAGGEAGAAPAPLAVAGRPAHRIVGGGALASTVAYVTAATASVVGAPRFGAFAPQVASAVVVGVLVWAAVAVALAAWTLRRATLWPGVLGTAWALVGIAGVLASWL